MAYRTDTLCGIFHNQALRYGDRFPFLTARFDKEGRPIDHFTSRSWKDTRDEVLDLVLGQIPRDQAARHSIAVLSPLGGGQQVQGLGAVLAHGHGQ